MEYFSSHFIGGFSGLMSYFAHEDLAAPVFFLSAFGWAGFANFEFALWADGNLYRITACVEFGNVNVCPAGTNSPAPCNVTLTLTYQVTAKGTFGTPQVLTQGSPGLDFTLASGSTCVGGVVSGSDCTVNVQFAPRFAGARPGAVELVDSGGNVIATTLIYGTGVGPQVAFDENVLTALPFTDVYFGAQGVVVNGAGDVFIGVFDYAGNGVMKLGVAGTQTKIVSGLVLSRDLAMDGAGHLYIADESNVWKTTVSVEERSTWG